ncbi:MULTISPECIES: hypothetical protein [Streptomyces]|uniref:Type II toxin-antitoxin system RelE/ParE family toxin n=2 Tax=Streptomyces rimosus subsp. rimosus TaxID=132474 RepID=L8EZC3_STRR1|nr:MULTISPECIES: hypothetical protein [Streptomyces]KOG70546.1 hypothetical protein ADK78_28575 [Kitasatospora aureofaciens]KPC88486.1 hypothetical protein ADL35_05450 [Streptomyces sp. NRRL WC-3753]MYT47326.1 hypothetical protein [Streptomyces sp. SID5471]KEF04656.1 hypothetical protein DF17_22475 [Streptomyces rimosus]KEF19925.1 hypothetical protein DF18_13895 [Streptomyces rimosus]
MTYRLRLDPTVHEDYRRLPDDARRDLAVCLLDALADPIAASTPYGVDDGVFRTIARGRVTGVIVIGDDTIALVQLTHLG